MPPAAGSDDRRRPFTGPLDAAELDRMLAVVDERVRTAPAAAVPAPPDPEDDAPLDAATTLEGESLSGLAAPLFHLGKGGPLARLAKAALNVPLGVLGRPQLHFNEAIRRVVRAWGEVLSAALDNLAALQRDAASQRSRLDELERRLARLERDEGDRPAS